MEGKFSKEVVLERIADAKKRIADAAERSGRHQIKRSAFKLRDLLIVFKVAVYRLNRIGKSVFLYRKIKEIYRLLHQLESDDLIGMDLSITEPHQRYCTASAAKFCRPLALFGRGKACQQYRIGCEAVLLAYGSFYFVGQRNEFILHSGQISKRL